MLTHYFRFWQLWLLLLYYLAPVGRAAGQCPTLVWSDEFDGAQLDAGKWTPQIGDGCNIGLCGWGNNELQWYQAGNAFVSNGTLKIVARRDDVGGRRYSSARLNTKQKGDWTYGRFEARIKLPTGQGIWPAFWMLPTDETYGGWPQSGEIDIMELVGKEPATAYGTIHFGLPWPNNRQAGGSYSLLDGIFNDDFHTFAVEWAPGAIRWYIDDYLYSTKTTADVSPRWPFDRRFHLLLNVAVGGNWPGNPDNTTVFPQTMEVDYVRVYDGYFPYIQGRRSVANRAQGVVYSIGNPPAGATFNWTAPAGATIVSGQGSAAITVNWGNAGGTLGVEVAGPCETRQYALNVQVEPALVPTLVLENFDDPAQIIFNFASGALDDPVANPASNAINGSPLSGRYTRNSIQQYDVLIYRTGAIGDAAGFVAKNRKFYIDLYTNARIGTQVLLQLENSSRAQSSNYPTGRHSRYEVRTTKQNEWERLEFQFLDQPDAGTSGKTIDQLVFLFASNSFTGNTYYWDNFEIYAPGSTTGLFGPITAVETLAVFPNPATGRLVVQAPAPLQQLLLTDLNGRVLRRYAKGLFNRLEIDIADLPAGVYLLQGIARDGRRATGRMVKTP